VGDYNDDDFEWDGAKSADRLSRSGFDFHFAARVLASDRYVERLHESHFAEEERWIATGLLEGVFISVVYVERPPRKRIISAFEADDADIAEYMITCAIEE
jgi:uncharacterized DUF497 family protein